MSERERLWSAIHELLPPGWRVGPPTYDPAIARWEIVSMSPTPGGRRGKVPTYVVAQGTDELGRAGIDRGDRLPAAELVEGGVSRAFRTQEVFGEERAAVVTRYRETSTFAPTKRLLTERLPEPDDHPVFRIG